MQAVPPLTWNQRVAVAILAAVTIVLFSRMLGHPFVNFDDPDYVTKNLAVQSGLTVQGAVWALRTAHASNWHPLTWLSHMMDCELFGSWAGGHHLTSLILHVANTLLLFAFLRRTTGAFWPSLAVAALFAWHPLHVESVAWVAERKDVLSAFFGFIAILAYLSYSRIPGVFRYLATLGAFSCSLLAKPMLVTLPLLLLLLDYWPLRRAPFDRDGSLDLRNPSVRGGLFKLILEKVPFLLVSAVSCLITIYAQKTGGAVASIERVPLADRLGNAVISYCMYLWHTVWPVNLAVFYPHPVNVAGSEVIAAAVVLLGATLVAVYSRRRFLVVGWFWYLGLLVPVIGILQVGDQAMADRYTYLPLIGIFIALVWAVDEVVKRSLTLRRVLPLMMAVLALGLGVLTWWQLSFWQSPERLFRRALQVTRRNYVAHNNLGSFLDSAGRHAEAKGHYGQALEIRPDFPITHYNLANSFAREMNHANAMKHYRSAVALYPRFAEAHYNLGVLLATYGSLAEAIEHHRIAVRCSPSLAEASHNLGRLLMRAGKPEEAVASYMAALRARPAWAQALIDLGAALEQLGKYEEAVGQYSEALRVQPDSPYAHSNLGVLLAKSGRLDEAERHLRQVVRADPGSPDAHYNLGNVLADLHRFEEAASEYREVLRLDPGDMKAAAKLEKMEKSLQGEDRNSGQSFLPQRFPRIGERSRGRGNWG